MVTLHTVNKVQKMPFELCKMIKLLFILSLLISQHEICAQSTTENKIMLDFPLIDYPFIKYPSKTNFATNNTWLNPSMNQALATSADVYFITHSSLKKLILKKENNSIWRKVGLQFAVLGADALTQYMPFGYVWTHEEFHRTIMTKNLVGSEDDANKFLFFSGGLKIAGSRDEDLAKFKKDNPKDFVRLHEAGMEGDYQLINSLEKNNFFLNQQLPNELLCVGSTVYTIGYVYASSRKLNDKKIDTDNAKETNILERDCVGPDFSAWTYHLFNQNQPYDSLGIHPTGIGINRYIKTTQLNPEELHYLRKQGNLAFLNLASPMLFGFRRIAIHKNDSTRLYYINFAAHHYLTSFGNDLCFSFLYQKSNQNWLFTLHNYNNYAHYFIGIETENYLREIKIGNRITYLTTRAMLWTQPKNQDFKTSKIAMGGLLETKCNYPIYKNIYANMSITAKTNGWVAGNEFLNANLSLTGGVAMLINR